MSEFERFAAGFDFALDEIRPIDEIGTEAFEVEEESGLAPLAPNVVLLEAARIFDERDRQVLALLVKHEQQQRGDDEDQRDRCRRQHAMKQARDAP